MSLCIMLLSEATLPTESTLSDGTTSSRKRSTFITVTQAAPTLSPSIGGSSDFSGDENMAGELVPGGLNSERRRLPGAVIGDAKY